MLAFIPLTFSSFWDSMAFTLIGGNIGETVLTLLFLPPLYVICVGAKQRTEISPQSSLNHATGAA